MDAPASEETPDQAAIYIALLTQEFAQIARRNGLDTLSHGSNVVCLSDRSHALLDQAVGAFGARIERGARHRKDFAALFQRASRAVISEPKRLAASTTTSPRERPEISRLRRGKSRARGSHPSGISVKANPVGRMSSRRSACSGG